MLALPLFYRIWIPGKGLFRIDSDFSKNTMFLWTGILSLAIFGKGRDIKRGYGWVYLLPVFLLLHTFSIQWTPYSQRVVTKMLMVGVGSAVFLQMVRNVNPFDKGIFFNFVGLAGIIQSVWIITQSFGYQPLGLILNQNGFTFHYENIHDGVVGSLNQQTFTGAFLAACLPAYFRKYWAFALPLALYGSWLTLSSMTFASVLSVFGVISVYRFSSNPTRVFKVGIFAMMAGLVALYFNPTWVKDTFFDDQERLFIWGKTFEFVSGWEILTGKGVGAFHDRFRLFAVMNPPWGHPHNEYLWFYVTFGLAGVIAGVYSFFRVWFQPVKDPTLVAGLAAIAVNSIGNFPLHIAPIAVLFMAYLAFLITDNMTIGENYGFHGN